MNDRYRQVSEIFEVACELAPADRADYLDVRCQGDPELRAEVEDLLRYDVDPEHLGTEAPPHRPLEPGLLFAGRYRILERRSRGSSGVVYRAVDERLGQIVALKVLRTSSPARLERLAHEVRLARRISHPAVCRVHDIGEADGEGYLTMEFVEGASLGDPLRRSGPLPPERVGEIARELLAGLAAAHAEGVLHGDLKPANLLVDPAGSLRISDFGTALGGGEDVGLPEGTPEYMAPERAQGSAHTARSDLYSLGVVLYELLTGALPPSPPPPLSHLVSAVDPRLERAVLAALEPDPARRPASARIMLEGLDSAVERDPAEAPTPLTGIEQRRITALFWERSDERDYAQQHGVAIDGLLEMFSERRAAADRIVARHGGFVSQRMGPRTLILFGVPSASADAPRRAARAALELIESSRDFDRRQAEHLPVAPEIRIGLHTAVSIVETSKNGEVYASGSVVNLAAELAARAEGQSALASDAVRSRAGGESSLDWVPRGKLALGPGADPIDCFELRRAESIPAAEIARPSGPLLGRQEELAGLEERWRRVRAGQGQVVLIRGEAGIGKSRLVQELRRRVEQPGLYWTEVSCMPYTANTPLYPLVEMFSGISDVRTAPPEQRVERAFAWLERNGLQQPEVRAGVERLLELHRRGSDGAPAPTAFGRDFFETLLPIAQRMAPREPLVVVFEDLQWADPSTLAILRLGVMAMGTIPALLVFTLPPDLELDWPSPEWLETVELGPLAEDELRALVEQHAVEPFAPEVRDAIAARAEGNPSFAVALAEAGPGPSGALPASLQDSLLARLDALGEAKRVAQLASVLGSVFRRSGLVALAEDMDARAVDAALHQLESAGVVACIDLPPEARYRFQQELLREAAYESLPPTRRARLHQRAAQMIEESEAGWVRRNPEVVAHHLEHAGLTEETVLAWERTADRAAETGAWMEAVAHLDRALDSAARLSRASGRDELELQLLLKRSRAMIGAGRPPDEVGATFDRAEDLCRRLPPDERVFRGLLEVWQNRARTCDGRSAELSEELARLAAAVGDRHLEASAATTRAQVASLQGRARDAIVHARRALQRCDQSRRRADAQQGRADVAALAQAMVSISSWLLGEPDGALEAARRAQTVARVLDAPHNSLVIDAHLATVLLWLGHTGGARAAVERLLRRPDRLGIGFFTAEAHRVRSQLLLEDDPDAALADARAAVELLEASRCDLGRGRVYTQLAEALAAHGEREAAVEAAREAVRSASHPQDCQLLAEAHRVLGERLLALDPRSSEGREQLLRALAVAHGQGALSLELRAALSLERHAWNRKADRARLRAVRSRFREGFATPDLREAARRLDASAA